jgi:hypothetical protein
MTTKKIIEAMASKDPWRSPEGKTPERTHYSAIARLDRPEKPGIAVQEGGEGEVCAVSGEPALSKQDAMQQPVTSAESLLDVQEAQTIKRTESEAAIGGQ